MDFKTMTVQALADALAAAGMAATVDGDPAVAVSGAAGLTEAGPGQLSFLSNPRYGKALETTRAAAVIVAPDVPRPASGVTLLRAKPPYLAFARALNLLVAPERPAPGVHAGAHVAPTATLGEGVTVMPGAYVGEHSAVGDRTVLHPNAVVLARCRVGADCLLYPGVVVREGCEIGDRAILHANVSIGADGYGFAQDEQGHHVKIPQVGTVVIEADVEIGAGTCIDRGALGPTVVGRGTKIDDLVMIGHGGRVGPHSLIVAQSGMAGSAVLEERVVLGARAGVLGHLTVGAGSVLYSRAHVTKSLPAGSVVSGNPARPHREELRQEALLRHLDRLLERVATLEAEVRTLRGDADEGDG